MAAYLNDNGYTKKLRQNNTIPGFSSHFVKSVLDNPVYMGKIAYDFIQYQKNLNSDTLNELLLKVKDLNNEIKKDKSLGAGSCIGHSYFCGKDVCTDEWLHEVVNYDILPMLREYWFDEPDKVTRWDNILQGVFQ